MSKSRQTAKPIPAHYIIVAGLIVIALAPAIVTFIVTKDVIRTNMAEACVARMVNPYDLQMPR